MEQCIIHYIILLWSKRNLIARRHIIKKLMVFVTKFRVVNYGSRLESIVENIKYIKEKYANFRFI